MLVPRPVLCTKDPKNSGAKMHRFSHISCGEFHSAAVGIDSVTQQEKLIAWGDCELLRSVQVATREKELREALTLAHAGGRVAKMTCESSKRDERSDACPIKYDLSHLIDTSKHITQV